MATTNRYLPRVDAHGGCYIRYIRYIRYLPHVDALPLRGRLNVSTRHASPSCASTSSMSGISPVNPMRSGGNCSVRSTSTDGRDTEMSRNTDRGTSVYFGGLSEASELRRQVTMEGLHPADMTSQVASSTRGVRQGLRDRMAEKAPQLVVGRGAGARSPPVRSSTGASTDAPHSVPN